jgi:hypothetical protein
MSIKTYWEKGSHNVICDICGFKFKSTETRKTWDNLIVCNKDFELKPPALIPVYPVKGEGRAVKNARPETTIPAGDIYYWEDMNFPWNIHNRNWEQYDGVPPYLLD